MSGGSAEARGAPPGRTHPPGRAIVDLDIQGQWRAGLVREPEDPGTGSPPRRHPHTPAMGRDLTLSLKCHPRAPGLQKAESDGCRHCTSRLSPTAWQGPTVLPRALARPQAGACKVCKAHLYVIFFPLVFQLHNAVSISVPWKRNYFLKYVSRGNFTCVPASDL